MKVLISVLAFVILLSMSVSAANNPIERGSTIFGGGVSFANYSGDSYNDQTVVIFSPSIGYFFSPGLMAGIDFNYENIFQRGPNVSSYGIGPTVGFFFNMNSASSDIKGNVYPYIKTFFIYYSFDEGFYKQTSYGGKGGFLYMLSNAVAADLGIRFSRNKEEYDLERIPYNDNTNSGTTFQLSVGMTTFLY